MADPRIHVIITKHDDDGVSFESPQLPELVGGEDSLATLRPNLVAILHAAGAPAEFKLVMHLQQYYDTPEGDEFAVRTAVDHRSKLRDRVAQRVCELMEHDGPRRDLLNTQHRDAAGVAVLAAFLETDPIWLLSEQLDPRGDAVAAALAIENADGRKGLWTTEFLRGRNAAGFKDLKGWGLNENDTMAQLAKAFAGLDVTQPRALAFA